MNASFPLYCTLGLIIHERMPEPFIVTFSGTSNGKSSMYVPGKICN